MANFPAAFDAYNSVRIATAGPRFIEADALERISGELARAFRNREKNYPAFVMALSRNSGLWTILASDVMAPDNLLPAELKAKIWSLAVFVQRTTQKLLSSDLDVDVRILIDINANVIQGLAGKLMAPTP